MSQKILFLKKIIFLGEILVWNNFHPSWVGDFWKNIFEKNIFSKWDTFHSKNIYFNLRVVCYHLLWRWMALEMIFCVAQGSITFNRDEQLTVSSSSSGELGGGCSSCDPSSVLQLRFVFHFQICRNRNQFGSKGQLIGESLIPASPVSLALELVATVVWGRVSHHLDPVPSVHKSENLRDQTQHERSIQNKR